MGLEQEVSDLQSRVTALESRATTDETRLSADEARLATDETQLNNLEGRVTVLEGSVSHLAFLNDDRLLTTSTTTIHVLGPLTLAVPTQISSNLNFTIQWR